MGFFDKLKQKSDNFFDGLQQNAIDKALAVARENDQKDDSVNKTKNLQQLYNNSSQEEKKDILEQQYENWLNTTSNSEIERQHLSQMIRMYSDEKLTPLETLIAERKGKNKLEWEKYCEIQNEKVKQAQLKENEKKERLLKIYTKEEVENIMSKKLWLGMTEEMLYEVRNLPLDISENVSKGVVKKKHYYDKSTNRLGNDAFDFEVTLEDGKVTGWKDRRNRGTRDI
jgi:hypothetical protein